MTEKPEKIDPHFVQLALSLQVGAMQQMGKIASPISGKIERDLAMAKHSIDTLIMLSNKTAGNLAKEEKELIDRLLYELRLNYVDEVKKDETSRAQKKAEKKSEEPTPDETAAEDPGFEQQEPRPDSAENGNL